MTFQFLSRPQKSVEVDVRARYYHDKPMTRPCNVCTLKVISIFNQFLKWQWKKAWNVFLVLFLTDWKLLDV